MVVSMEKATSGTADVGDEEIELYDDSDDDNDDVVLSMYESGMWEEEMIE